MDDARHLLGSQKALPARIEVKLSREPPSYRHHPLVESCGREIRRYGTSCKDEQHVNFRGPSTSRNGRR